MDGPLRPVELEEPDELERLRRRAYGPDADIADDAAAQARLLELEEARRRWPALADDMPAAEAVPDAASRPAARRPPTGEIGEPPADAPAVSVVEEPADALRDAARRRRRGWMVAGGVLAVLALIGTHSLVAGYVASTSPPSTDYVVAPDYRGIGADYVLAQIPDGTEPADPDGTLERLGLTPDDLRRYQDFQEYGVWSGKSRFGTTCLIVTRQGQALTERSGTEGCSPAGVDTPADLLVLDSPTRDLVRFVLRNNYVAVYVYVKASRMREDRAAP